MARTSRALPSERAPESDEDLIKRIAHGDAPAFRTLAERYAESWHALARRLLGRGDLAEDVVQELFMQVWSRPDRFQPMGARFSTWSYRVLVNRCIDVLRAKRARHAPIEFDPVDPAEDALTRLIERERSRRLEAEIGKLPARQRAALSLVYTAGLSNKEAALALDISLKALETLLVRAKRALRGAFDGGEENA